MGGTRKFRPFFCAVCKSRNHKNLHPYKWLIFKLFTLFGIEGRFVNVKTPIYFRKTAFRPNKAAFCFCKAAREAKQHQDNFALQGQKRVSKMVIFAVKMVIFCCRNDDFFASNEVEMAKNRHVASGAYILKVSDGKTVNSAKIVVE